ncbi:hypothetical protein MTW91_01870 [Mammaliicoccus sciuri]|uniref:hypothetical protein n=1 Tax=Mammaliicoccus sciuri TaxID=1296 RepID=UPI001FB37BDB|nr:hypothetical protein [Mammaliicoccus sciuri]MCJ0924031.1 hypothetical protein [Mammaliicoccus sciuri]
MELRLLSKSRTEYIVRWYATVNDFIRFLSKLDNPYIKCADFSGKDTLLKVSAIESITVLEDKKVTTWKYGNIYKFKGTDQKYIMNGLERHYDTNSGYASLVTLTNIETDLDSQVEELIFLNAFEEVED